MSKTQYDSVFPGDEIAIVELWRIFVRRWRWITAGLAAALIVAAVYVFHEAPTFEARAKIRIGQVADTGLFESGELLASRLLARYGERIADGVTRSRPLLKRAGVTVGVPGAIDLVAEGDRPEDAVALLERVFAEVDKTHGAIYGRNLKYLQERLQNIEMQRDALSIQYASTSALLERLKNDDPVQASLLALERGRISSAIMALDAEKPGVAQRLTPPQTRPTELLGEITAPVRPVWPRSLIVFAIAVALGLLMGGMLAFAAELAARAGASRERHGREE